MNVLDSTAINVAVPNITSSLGASTGEILWVLNGYIFPFAMLLLLGGRLGDILGHRNIFFAGLLLFTLTSLMCALATSPEALIVGRVLQGIGAAAAAPQALAITAAVFPPERRAMAFGVLASVIGSAAAAAPILGGVLIDLFDWRAIFYLNLPIGVIGLLATFFVLPATRDRGARGVPFGSTLLVSAGLFLMLYALIEGQRYDWGAVWGQVQITHLLLAGALILLVFFLVERRSSRDGLLPRATFTSRNYALMIWASIATYFGIFGTQLVMTIYLQAARDVGPLQTGIVLAPMWVAASLAAPVAGRLSARLSGKALLTAGFTVFALGAALTALLAGMVTPWWTFMLTLIVAGVGAGLTFAPVSTVAMQEITPDAFGRASGLIEVVRQVGAAVCIATVGAVMQAVWVATLRDETSSAAQGLSPADQAAVSSGVDDLAERGLDAGSTAVDSGSPLVDRVLGDASLDSLIAAAGPALLVTAGVILTAAVASLFVRGTAPRRESPERSEAPEPAMQAD